MDVSKQSDTGGFFGWLDKAADYAQKGAEVYATVKAANEPATPTTVAKAAVSGMLGQYGMWIVGGVTVLILFLVLRKS